MVERNWGEYVQRQEALALSDTMSVASRLVVEQQDTLATDSTADLSDASLTSRRLPRRRATAEARVRGGKGGGARAVGEALVQGQGDKEAFI